MLFAQRGRLALALACSVPWLKRSAGFVGASDGWQDVSAAQEDDLGLRAGRERQRRPDRRDGPVGGRRPVRPRPRLRPQTTARPATARGPACLQGFEAARKEYVQALDRLATSSCCRWSRSKTAPQDLYHISAAVMRTHESKEFPGGIIASLAIPWGFAHGDGDLGYHLVWPRDMIETVGGLLAIQQHEDARRVLFYFQRHAGRRRPLAAEHVARRPALLERHPARRDGLRHPAGGPGAAREGPGGRRPRRPLADGPPGGRATWSATARSRRWTAGRRRPATSPPRWRWRSPRCSSPPTWPKPHGESRRRRRTCARPPTPGTTAIERLIYVTGTDLARAGRRGRLLRPLRRARIRWQATVAGRRRGDPQEPPPGQGPHAGRRPRQPRRPGAGPLRPARRRRSAHRQHGEGHRPGPEGGHARAARAGTATTTTATANTPTARPSTAPASAAPGRC